MPNLNSLLEAPVPIAAPDFRLLFESAPGLYLVLSPDFRIVAVSDTYLRATMTQREEIVGRPIFDVFPDNPNDPAATGVENLTASLRRVVRDRVADAMAVQKYDIRRPDAEGGGFEERYWSAVNCPVLGADGSLAYIIHRVEDVTDFIRLKMQGVEQERLTQELRARGKEMETEIFARAQEIQEANRRLREANSQLTTFHAELEKHVQDRTVELARANDSLQAEFRERKMLEEQLRHVQKMEAVGQLAGGIAHDFNNLLTVISSYSEMIIGRLPADNPDRSLVQEIYKAGERAAMLTRQLLAFSRKQVLDPRIVDINSTVQNAGNMLRRLIGEHICLTTKLADGLDQVCIDPGQLEQVIINLAVNARDAMARGGCLTIETANVILDKTYARTHLEVKPGSYVMLAVCDTGHGMNEATKRHIFEPFFTTKEVGKGTGLGLATVYGIIKQSGGSIWVYSEPARGTTFKVYLPAMGRSSVLDNSANDHEPDLVGKETILVVEDESAVRAATRIALQNYGYTILEACNGEEAVRLYQQHQGPIHLLLTDVVMPGMSGRQLVETLRGQDGAMKILYLSGYTDDAVVRHGVLQAEAAFLQKPFAPLALAKKVREVLDQHPG